MTTLQMTFSEIASFLDCGMAYRLRNLLGFQPRLAPELGYGKAVHHVLRMVAEQTKATGAVPHPTELDELLDESFFLPAANKPAHRQLKEAARRLVSTYAADHADDLHRVWETERPFELHLDGITVVGSRRRDPRQGRRCAHRAGHRRLQDLDECRCRARPADPGVHGRRTA